MAPNRRKRGTHAGTSRRKKTATMAGTSTSKDRIVPVLSETKRPVPKSSRNGSRSLSLRQQLLKGEFDKDVLKLPCLDELRLYAAPIRGDGNCLFSSLSDQLYGYPDRHEEIRQRLVDHVRDRSDYFMQFVSDVGGERRAPRRAAAAAALAKQSNNVGREATEEGQRAKFEKLLTQMGKNGFWGGSVELQAFCQAYEKDVMVYTEHGIQTFTGDSAPDGQEREAVHVAYHSFEHYSSVRSIDGPHTGLPRLSRHPGQNSNAPRSENGDGATANGSSQMVPRPLDMAEPWKISSIAEALPGFDHETIRAVLTKCRGDINNAFSRLLDADFDGPLQEDSASSSFHTPPPSSSASANSQPRDTPAAAVIRPSSRVFLGSSSRSSSRHSTASKRSADQSDDEEGPISMASKRRRGRDRKRRILQDVTVGIAVRDEDESDVISIKLRVDPNAVVEHANHAPQQTVADASSTEDSRSDTEQSDDRRAGTVSDSTADESFLTVSEGVDSGQDD